MKKIFTLLALVMLTVCAMAETRTYKGTWHSNPGNFADSESTVVVSQDAEGRYTLIFDHVVLGNDDLGRLTFAGVSNLASAGYGGFTLSQEGGNVVINNYYIEFLDNLGKAGVDDEHIYVKFRYFEYNSTYYQMVVFEGKRTSSGSGSTDPEGPSISATEQFTADVATEFGGTMLQEPVVYPNVKANLCEWTDGTYSIELANVDTEHGTFSGMLLKGLQKSEGDSETYYTGVVTPTFQTVPQFYQNYTNLKADVNAVVDEDGELHVTAELTDESEPSFHLTVWFNMEEETELSDPVSISGNLYGYTVTDDGEFSNNASSVLTFTETAEDVYTVTLTNVALPSASISLGTVTIEGVACESNEAALTGKFTKNGGECTTEAEHPIYTTVALTSFEANVALEPVGEDDVKVKSCTATLVIDNYDESVAYTFSFDPTAASVKTIETADGTVKRIYTLGGARVNTLQRGVNIVRTADGKTVKVLK